MLVRYLLFSDCLEHLHRAHHAEDTVVVAAVLYAVHVGAHYDALCVRVGAGERRIHARNVVHFDGRADRLHSAAELVSCLDSFRREGVPGDTAVACVAEFAESFDLVLHSVIAACVHKNSPLLLYFCLIKNKRRLNP